MATPRTKANGNGTAAAPPVSASKRQRAINDSLENLVTGFGTARDKSTYSTYGFTPLDRAQLEAAFRSDWIARKVVRAPASDETREWRAWQAEGADIEKIEEVERALRIQQKVRHARTLARLYGGSLMFLGVEGSGEPEDELIWDTVKLDSLKYVHVVSRWHASAGPVVQDVMSPFFGEHEYYQLQGANRMQVRVHPSRVIKLIGEEPPDIIDAQGWGDSALQPVDDAIKAVGLCSGGLAHLVWELKIDIIKVPNLMLNIADADYRSRLIEKYQLANIAKSTVNSLLLDKEEEWQRVSQSLAGADEILKVYLLIASGAADIPATRMLGQSPAGLSATGESDIRNYYDRISSGQKNDLAPSLERLDEVMLRSTFGTRPEDIYYEWRPLWQTSGSEEAEIAKKKAEAFKIDAELGLIPDLALAQARVNQLIEDGIYPGLEGIMEEVDLETELEENELDENSPEVIAAEAARAANENVAPPEEGDEGDGGAPAPRRAVGDWAYAAERQRRKRQRTSKREGLKDAQPRTLYVRRDLLNGDEVAAWARAQGLEVTVPPEAMHVTIAFSRTPVDWIKVGESYSHHDDEDGGLTVKPGGPRVVETLGPKNAVVLLFASSHLCWRHEDIKHSGASWDWPDYQPHISISFGSDDPAAPVPDLSNVEPFRGELRFGPEIFEEVNDDWASSVKRRT